MDSTPYVLLVEDDKNIAETMRLVLANAGVQLRVASNLDQAQKLFDEQVPDYVLLDYLLDGKTPEAFVTYIRSKSTVPIILVTAVSQAEAIAEALQIKTLIKKPFDIETLLTAIHANLTR